MTSISTRATQARETSRETDGKFGHQEHDRADGIDLGADLSDPQDVVDRAREAARRDRLDSLPSLEEIRRLEAPSDDELIASKAMLQRIQRIARRDPLYDAAYDASDAAADTILELHRMHREGKLNDPERIPNTMIAKIIAGSKMRQSGQPSSRHTTAISSYGVARREREVSLGRGLSRTEENELAEKVRLQIPSKNRPPAGYHRPTLSTSLEALVERQLVNDGSGSSRFLADSGDPYVDVVDPQREAPLEAIGRIEDAVERATADGDINRQDLLRRPWAAAAMLFESGHPDSGPMPPIAEQSHKPSRIHRASADLKQRGGAAKAAHAYLDGITADDPSLFAPFDDDLTDDQKTTVAEFMVHLSDTISEEKANKVHTTALSTSRTDSGSTTSRVRDALDLEGAW